MKRLAWSMFAAGLVTGALIGRVAAQDNIVTEAPAASIAQVPAAAQTYDDYKRHELELSSRRSRNALIGTSAAAVVGTALLFPAAAKQCYTFDFGGTTEVRCSTAGKVMLGFGLPLFVGGLTGVLVSGIMFGVRKGKLRRLNDRMAYEKSRAVRWDPASSRFVF
jgi:hypothetical protein